MISVFKKPDHRSVIDVSKVEEQKTLILNLEIDTCNPEESNGKHSVFDLSFLKTNFTKWKYP